MNSKYIFILMLLFIMSSTVSASHDLDNITSDIDNCSLNQAENVLVESTEDSSQNQSLISNSSQDISSDDFKVFTEKSLSLEDDEWDYPKIIVADFPKDGSLQIFVKNSLKFSKNINASKDKYVSLDIDDVKGKLGMKKSGEYSISIKYLCDDKDIQLTKYNFYVYDEDFCYIPEIAGINGDSFLRIVNPTGVYLTGTVKINLNGKQVYSKKFKASDKKRVLNLKVSDLGKSFKAKDYTVKVIYCKFSTTRTVKFMEGDVEIYYPSYMAVGENQKIILKTAKSSSGTLRLFNALNYNQLGDDWEIYFKADKVAEAKISNGIAKINLNKLNKSNYKFILEYEVGNYKDSNKIFIDVFDNAKGYNASVSPASITHGGTFKVKFTGPKTSKSVDIYVDNQYKASIKLSTGSVKYKVSNLRVGKHTIRAQYWHGSKYYSKTFDVVVKKSNVKLTLSKVKVKKSAKKLTIKAKLKIKGKIAKGKKLTFKFKGKKYTAKTNKKGIAKITIKKKVLNNLKKGKKITYQVKYSTTTVKKTVKVQ